MAWYRVGTISVTNGSATVTGSGTQWIANAAIGEGLRAPDGRIYEIINIASNTSLTITPNYLGSNQSGQAYEIVPTQSFLRDLAAQAADLVNQYSTIANTVGQGKFADGTVGTPGIRFNDDPDTGLYRIGANILGISAGGGERFRATSTGVQATGTLTATGNTSLANLAYTGTLTGSTGVMNIGSGQLVKDASGNVGVGTASPVDKLQINGGTVASYFVGGSATARRSDIGGSGAAIQVEGGFTSQADLAATRIGNEGSISLSRQNGSNPGDNTTISQGQALGSVRFLGADGTQLSLAAVIRGTSDGAISTGVVPGRLGFLTASPTGTLTERMRITSSGNVGIGTTSPGSALQVQGLITGTAVTQTATDTTANRLLKVGDFGVGGVGSALAGSEGTPRVSGFYRTTSADNFPITDGNLISISRNVVDRTSEILIQCNAATPAQRIYFRSGDVSQVNFSEIYHNGNILGTVSQASGLPTGAVIERGSNANGAFVRFADGTQICTSPEFSHDVTTASGNGFVSADQTWTYPVNVIANTATVHGAGATNQVQPWVSAFDGNAVGSARYNLKSFVSATARTVRLTAIGRWF